MKHFEASQTSYEQPTLPFEMSAIPATPEAQDRRGWTVAINGENVEEPVESASLTQGRMGIDIEYGQRPEGYDGVVIRERGGGGAVTIPYMVHPNSGDVYVGVVEEFRPTLGGNVLNVPRGFMDAGETHRDTATRELQEETGFKAIGSRVVQLAQGLNPNSTYFDTSRSEDEGVSIFAVPVHESELDHVVQDDGSETYVFPGHIRQQAEGNKPAERILGSKFVLVEEAMQSRDMFTSAAAGHLLTGLFTGRLPYITGQQV